MLPSILADESVDFRIIKFLRKNGIEVTSIHEEYKGIPDREILGLSRKLNCLLLTEDSDFGEWIFAYHKRAVGVVFLRYAAKNIMGICESVYIILNKHQEKLYQKFVTITINKVRIRDISH